MGKYDFVENVFAEFGVEVLFDRVAMKPGKPTVFGYRERYVCFRFAGKSGFDDRGFSHVRHAGDAEALLKATDTAWGLLRASLEAPAKCDPARTAIVPALVRFEGQSYRIRTAPWKGSSDLAGLSRANALVVIPKAEGSLQAGRLGGFLLAGVVVSTKKTDTRRFKRPVADGGRHGEGAHASRCPRRGVCVDVAIHAEAAARQ